MSRAPALLLTALSFAGLLALAPEPASAEQVVQCESDHGRYARCDLDTRGGVRLQQQLSRATCRYNDTWGYDRGGIWVHRGCRARFVVSDPGWHDSSSGGWGPSHGETVRCESDRGRRETCRTRTRGGVRLARQLSRASCVYGRTWGYDRNSIWVDRGCRGLFEVGRGETGSPRPTGTVTCESDHGRRNYCRADTRGGVRLQKQLSRSDCHFRSSWGYDSGGIWVRDGCRGRFTLGGGYGYDGPSGSSHRDDDRLKSLAGGALLIGAIAAIASSAEGNDDERSIEECRDEVERQLRRDYRDVDDLRFGNGASDRDGAYREVFGDGRASLDGRHENFRFECRVRSSDHEVVSADYDL